MKKLFHHTKRPVENWKGYDGEDYDWDESDDDEYSGEEGYYAEESGYYGEAENFEQAEYCQEAKGLDEFAYYGEAEEIGESGYYEEAEEIEESGYYEEGEDPEESGYYEEAEEIEESGYYEEAEDPEEFGYYGEAEEIGESGYCEEGEDPEEFEYYAESESYDNPEYYGETEGFEESGYYGEEEEFEDPEYYGEGQYDGDAAFEDAERKHRPQEGIFRKLQQGLGSMGVMDKVILVTGAAVLALAMVVGSVFVSSRIVDGQVADFASVGSQLEGIDIIGGRGLLAVADAELARMAAAEAVREQETAPPKEYQETEYGRDITVSLGLTSVQKDLKIKFTNKANGKLISNVPFAVTVTGPDGKSVVWSDDDMDGIIYKKDLAPGNYSVAMEPFSNEQYSDYHISETAQKVEVKKDIDYKKIDVTNEIKKESEINVAKEDTKQNVTVVESVLADTVEWVESKVMEATYNEVPKSSIPDLDKLVSAGGPGALIKVAETGTVSGTDPVIPTPEPTPVPTPTPVPLPVLQGMTLDKTEVVLLSATTATVQVTLTGAAAVTPVVSAASADTNVATVAVSGTTVTVTGTGVGSTAVTVSYTENGQTVTGNFTVTVKSNPRNDTVTKLKDNSGNQLFVLSDGQYKEAVYADYYTADRFFVRGEAKYTGWQTLNGNVYYFTANGDKVTGEQVIQGARYNFASDGSLVKGSGNMGIDVSKWNGNIDWSAVSNSGVSYVIIRCGYRGSSEGKLIEDSKFAANIKGATAAGLKVGVYFFTQAVDEVEAVEEASMVLDQIRGYKISYPVFLDVEPSGGRADSIDSATRTAVCRAFCETIQRGGYTAGVYANKTWLTSKLNAGELGAYKIWLAQYAASPTYTGRYDLWQYKSTGSVSGIKGNVDMNLSYLGY